MVEATTDDVIDEVLKDHAEIKQLFAQVESASGEAKRQAFEALAQKLTAHETAEQEVVHPLTRRAGAEDVVGERLTEEKEGEEALAELQRIGPEDPEFETQFQALKADVLKHASLEEAQEHPRIRATVDSAQLQRLGEAFRAAEAEAS